MKAILTTSLFLILLTSGAVNAQDPAIDAYWDEVSRVVAEGDFEGYAVLYHEDAVLVNGMSGSSYSIKAALAGWKQGFDDTKAGKQESSVEFGFSERIHDENTAHDTGIFKYSFKPEGGEWQSVYIHFSGLFVKKEGKWLLVMEYQQSVATEEEWEGLK